ncbi:unnamed protein product [Agarophyton chilense]|eukprot:gb/GEZJ01003088.1/.p1 GENE.gb/GEZJ01003088.1/~~gb/GEZJ01003088.1/.p1  ORF type:complete len:459 (-),score=66.61 gb/GEZJ01003088.1/:1079-2455(-)
MSYSSGCNSVSILVHPNDLRGGNRNGVRKENRLARRKCFRMWRRVSVEAAPALVRDRIFYAADEMHDAEFLPRTPTEFIKGSADSPNVVHSNDEFEISFIGMNVTPQDTLACNENELLLYSLDNDYEIPLSTRTRRHQSERSIEMENGYLRQARLNNDSRALKLQNFSSLSSNIASGPSVHVNDLPFIHYDPLRDGRKHGTEPNSYVTIPASMALYKQYKRRDEAVDSRYQQNASVRFNLLDLDNINDEQLDATSSITQLGELVEMGAVAVPYAELIANAFQVVAAIGKRGLEKYSTPDLVFSVDIQFRLAEATSTDYQVECDSQTSVSMAAANNIGNYLRYGYYFFLEKSVDVQLYAQTRSSSQYVPLLMRRTDLRGKRRGRNDVEYFPLTNVSYVVMKVSPGCTQNIEARKTELFAEHKNRLDTVLHARNISEMLTKRKKKRRSSTISSPKRALVY